MTRLAIALIVLLAGCGELPDKLSRHVPSIGDDDDAGASVGSSSQALTGPVGYTYVNSNNGAALGGDDRWLAGIRCWAMTYHTQNGHNYWFCEHSTTNALYCAHNPLPTSGVTSMYLDQCTNSSPWSCKMHISGDGLVAGQKPIMGTMSWSPNSPMGEIRSYAFNDGTVGSCSAANGNGLFQEWSP